LARWWTTELWQRQGIPFISGVARTEVGKKNLRTTYKLGSSRAEFSQGVVKGFVWEYSREKLSVEATVSTDSEVAETDIMSRRNKNSVDREEEDESPNQQLGTPRIGEGNRECYK